VSGPRADDELGHDGPAAARPLAAMLDRAERWIEAQRYEQAASELERALAMDPDHVRARLLFARVEIGRESWPEAETHAARAVALAPDHPGALGMLAAIALRQGRYGEAEERVLAALRVDPEAAWLYELYGDVMRLAGHQDKARRLYERGLALAPEDSDLHAKLALVAVAQNRVRDASERAGASLAHGAEASLGHTAAGLALLRGGRPFAARAALREALRLQPEDADLAELWRDSDRCCRFVYLPMYYFSLVIGRLPGQFWTLWGAFVLFVAVSRSVGLPGKVVAMVAIPYLALVVYTWIADPLVNLWLELRPARL
jgi:predicted Zn-dependent protease